MNPPLPSTIAIRPGRSARAALAASIATALSIFNAEAVDVIKANNTDALNLTSSWLDNPNPNVPGTSDVAVWNNTVAAANTVELGGAADWQGIRIANPGGAVVVTHAAGDSLTLGTGGIDLSAAAANLTLLNTANTPGTIAIGASQVWTAGTGRTLTLFGTSNSQNQALTGAGNIQVLGAGTVAMNVGDTTSTGFTDGGNSGFSGNWTIGDGTTGSARLVTLRNGVNAFGTGTVTMNGGTIAQTQGNWTWTSNLTLATGASSTIEDANTSGTTRSLKLQGVISGDGNITFADPNNRMGVDQGFILTGNNTLSGTVTIAASGDVRVGGVPGNDAATGAGSGGTLGTASVSLAAANSTLTLSRNNTWTFANTVSGAGVLRIGLNTGSSSHMVTLTGNNSHTGGTTMQSAVTVKIGNANALGTGPFTIAGNGFFDNVTGGAITVPNALALSGGSPTFNGSNDMTFNGAVTLANANRTLTVNGSTLTLNGNISGPFNLTKAGIGTLVLGGTNTQNATTVTGGTLVLDYGTNDTSKLTDGQILTLGAVGLTLAGATGSHTELVNSTTLTGAVLLKRSGANTAEISLGAITRNANAFLDVQSANLANTTTANVNGVLEGVTLGGANLAANDGADNIVAFTAYSDVTRLESGTKTIADGATQQIRIVDGTGSTPADVTLAAAGTTTIDNFVNSATGGAATVDIGAGNTLRLGAAGALLAGAGTGGLTFNNGALTAGGADDTAGALFVSNSGAPMTIAAEVTNNGSGTVALTKAGSGTVALSGFNTYTGATVIREGTLEVSGGSAISDGGAVTLANVTGASLKLNDDEAIGNLTGGGPLGGSVDLGTHTLTVATSTGVQVLGGALSGSGTVFKTGAGALTLEGTNSFSGLYDISSGALAFRTLGSDNGKPAINVSSGAEFALGGEFAGQTSTISALSGGGVVTAQFDAFLGTKTLEVEQATDTTFSGIIRNNIDGSARVLALVKSGAGTLALAGANTFTGGVSITAGTLDVNTDAALGASSGPVAISNNAELQASGDVLITARTVTLGIGGGRIDTNGSSVTFDLGTTIAGTTLTKTGAGKLVLAGTQTYATLDTEGGRTDLASPLGTGTSSIVANADVNISASQTLASLVIGAGAVVTLGTPLPPAPGEEAAAVAATGFDSGRFDAAESGAGASIQGVPEPGSLALLLPGFLGLLRRPRARARRTA